MLSVFSHSSSCFDIMFSKVCVEKYVICMIATLYIRNKDVFHY